jgi:PBP1b-binding outer membrane lipoprotein LpoB
MKHLKVAVIALGGVLVLLGCSQKATEITPAENSIKASQFETTSFKVEGFT